MIAYTSVTELHSKSVTGTALALINGMSVVIGAFCQQAVGALIDWLSTKGDTINNGASIYNLKLAMSVAVISLLIAFLCSFFIKETFKK